MTAIKSSNKFPLLKNTDYQVTLEVLFLFVLLDYSFAPTIFMSLSAWALFDDNKPPVERLAVSSSSGMPYANVGMEGSTITRSSRRSSRDNPRASLSISVVKPPYSRLAGAITSAGPLVRAFTDIALLIIRTETGRRATDHHRYKLIDKHPAACGL